MVRRKQWLRVAACQRALEVYRLQPGCPILDGGTTRLGRFLFCVHPEPVWRERLELEPRIPRPVGALFRIGAADVRRSLSIVHSFAVLVNQCPHGYKSRGVGCRWVINSLERMSDQVTSSKNDT